MTAAEGPSLSAPEAARGVLEGVEAGRSVALFVVVDDPDGGRRSRRLLVTRSERRGSLGDEALDDEAAELARRALDDPDAGPDEGTHELSDRSGRTVRVYLEVHHPQPELIVVGAGHIAQPLSTIGDLLAMQVTVLDDRPDFATRERFPAAERVMEVDFSDPFADVPIHRLSHLVLVTRGHKYDYECLRRVLRVDPQPAYIGMIGSRRRVRATYAQLLDEGIPFDRIATVHAPVGLDLGAETPGEIAVSVASEIVVQWRGGSGRPLREEERVLERFFSREDEDATEDRDDAEDEIPEGADGGEQP